MSWKWKKWHRVSIVKGLQEHDNDFACFSQLTGQVFVFIAQEYKINWDNFERAGAGFQKEDSWFGIDFISDGSDAVGLQHHGWQKICYCVNICTLKEWTDQWMNEYQCASSNDWEQDGERDQFDTHTLTHTLSNTQCRVIALTDTRVLYSIGGCILCFFYVYEWVNVCQLTLFSGLNVGLTWVNVTMNGVDV